LVVLTLYAFTITTVSEGLFIYTCLIPTGTTREIRLSVASEVACVSGLRAARIVLTVRVLGMFVS